MSYDPNTPTVMQSGGWQCSAASSAWVLRSLGVQWSQDDVVGWLGPRNITEASGLQEASGRMLALLFKERGFESGFGPISWERALAMAGKQPFCIGGMNWNHWSAVRGTDGQRLFLANPAPSWQGVGQEMDLSEWNALGNWNAAWADVASSLEQAEADSPGISQSILEWQRARFRGNENPNDYAACRAHLVAIGKPDLGARELDGFRRATVADLEADNPLIREQVAQWQQARRQNREDPNDYPACRDHLVRLGSADPGPAEFLGFVK